MDESFLPYAMIAPLLTPGMTWGEFIETLMARLALPRDRYKVQAMAGRRRESNDPVRLGEGVRIWTVAQRDALLAANLTHIAPPDTRVIR